MPYATLDTGQNCKKEYGVLILICLLMSLTAMRNVLVANLMLSEIAEIANFERQTVFPTTKTLIQANKTVRIAISSYQI